MVSPSGDLRGRTLTVGAALCGRPRAGLKTRPYILHLTFGEEQSL